MLRLVAGPGSFRISANLGNRVEVPGVPGLTLADAWRTEGIPVVNSAQHDLSKDGNFSVAPDGEGTVFRIITFPTKSVLDNVPGDVMSRLGLEVSAAPSEGLMWHQTNTIDYVTIVSGQIEFVTEVDRHLLRTGDIAIVRGILHAWVNPLEEMCVMSCVSIAAQPRFP